MATPIYTKMSQGLRFDCTAVDPSPLLLPNASGRLAVLGMLYIMYVG